ncbi:SOUL heme-binding protein-domain-containing protein [Pelagophyceae sp. CCMP2097]|nr:SOUL heme-binding protein-domain-containing protein [Pelagophyceae sp. CCMP2097]
MVGTGLSAACAFALVATTAALAPKPTWQLRLDRALLDVDCKPRQRLKNLQKVVGDPAVLTDVRAAVEALREKGFAKGHAEAIDRLWPSGTIARADLDALRLLRKQVPEGLAELREQRQRGTTAKTPTRAPDASKVSKAVREALKDLATDASKREALVDEALNALRATPKGLETPAYTVDRVLEGGVEVRSYEAYTVARLKASAGMSSDGADFGELASYLFGDNADDKAMSMTMPVETAAESSAMAFVLPKAFSDAPPKPKSDKVDIAKIPARTVLAIAFGGIATKQEVDRQRKMRRPESVKLLAALAAAPDLVAAADDECTLLQYNAPYTIPWRRKNELVLRVDVVDKSAGTESPMKAPDDAPKPPESPVAAFKTPVAAATPVATVTPVKAVTPVTAPEPPTTAWETPVAAATTPVAAPEPPTASWKTPVAKSAPVAATPVPAVKPVTAVTPVATVKPVTAPETPTASWKTPVAKSAPVAAAATPVASPEPHAATPEALASPEAPAGFRRRDAAPPRGAGPSPGSYLDSL